MNGFKLGSESCFVGHFLLQGYIFIKYYLQLQNWFLYKLLDFLRIALQIVRAPTFYWKQNWFNACVFLNGQFRHFQVTPYRPLERSKIKSSICADETVVQVRSRNFYIFTLSTMVLIKRLRKGSNHRHFVSQTFSVPNFKSQTFSVSDFK